MNKSIVNIYESQTLKLLTIFEARALHLRVFTVLSEA